MSLIASDIWKNNHKYKNRKNAIYSADRTKKKKKTLIFERSQLSVNQCQPNYSYYNYYYYKTKHEVENIIYFFVFLLIRGHCVFKLNLSAKKIYFL